MINENYISDGLTETLPEGLINLGDDNHVDNMANFSMYVNAKQAVSTLSGDVHNKAVIPQSELDKFGNWTGQTDTKVMAADLKKRGLIGAQQLIEDSVDITSPDRIRNSQSDWKPAAIQQIVSNARKLNLRKPEEILANKDILISNPKWKDAINNDSFKTIHPNFWDIITKSIIPEQYAKMGRQETNSIVKK